jgi:hypothetical protein
MNDYYDFFKNERSENLYSLVRKCLSFGEIQNGGEIYKSIGEKAKQALHKIGSENRINQRRVSTLYGIEVGTDPDEGILHS